MNCPPLCRQRALRAQLKIAAWVFAFGFFCSAQTSLNITLVVTSPVIDMYSAASRNADVVSQAIYGSNVRLLEQKPGWARVQTSDHYTGWVSLDNVIKLNGGDAAYASSGKIVQVNSLSANLYREPDVTAHRPLLRVPFETRLEVVAQSRGNDERWLQMRLPDQQLAWIQSGDIDPAPRLLSIDESIALGKRFLGVTYTWGGRSSFGFDCSGFTQMLVRTRGINMPRDADLQAAWDGAVRIDRKELRSGDLLFFGSDANHITHTGMFIGGGEFIHDTTYGHPGVQISRLDDQPWTKLLVACRRIK
jgi:gamma-D-glutamyl-L-lysine dipeptidyl-peptidase